MSTGIKIVLESSRMDKPPACDIVSMVMNRGRGRPRKDHPFETGHAEASGRMFGYMQQVSPKQEEDLTSREKTQTEEGVVASGDGKETGVTMLGVRQFLERRQRVLFLSRLELRLHLTWDL